MVAAITAKGGTVTKQFRYVDAIAATIPAQSIAAIRSTAGVASVSRDVEVPLPRSVDVSTLKKFGVAAPLELSADSIQALSPRDIAGAGASPAAYIVNNTLMGLDPLHAAGQLGQDGVVALIDSGIRPGFPHIAGTVIGGEDFVGDGLGYSNFANNGHGTFVSGMIAAHVGFLFSDTSALVKAINLYAPGATLPYSPGTTLVPMIGTAPAASIYALRVFGPTGGSPTSTIMAAMERAIELRELYNAGDPAGVNIRVCNMSLGGATVDPGLDAEDQLIDAMLAHDIVPVIAAGNAGPAALTVGSPGTAYNALTVGAANLAHNERILRDLQYGPGIGGYYRPSAAPQMSYFSSRGPDADGRVQPNVVANGFASFGMGLGSTTLSISIGNGTSFATPSVTGIAAVLRGAFPNATARQIRNAIIMSANPAVVSAASNLDQGAGFVNAAAARDLLATGKAPDTYAPTPKPVSSVKVNIATGGLNVADIDLPQSLTGLKPGERHDIVVDVKPNTKQLVVTISGFSAAPAAQQNAIFGDDLLVAIHTAKTSSIGEGDYQAFQFLTGGTLVVNNPETGLLRVSVSGDWTNASPVSATVTVIPLLEPIPQFTAGGKIVQTQDVLIPFTVPAGTKLADFRLGWRDDWGTFPTADVDLILIGPSTVNLSGATLNNPESATITNPEPGKWLAWISGFNILQNFETYQLRIALDGRVIH